MRKKQGKKKKLSKLTLGIDPGKKGAIVLLKKGKMFKQYQMPLIGGKVVDIHTLDSIFKKYGERIEHAWIEKVAAMPRQGVVSMFSFGVDYGILQGLLAGNRIPFTLIRPQEWQREMFKGVSVIKKTKKKQGKNKTKKNVKVLDNKSMALIAAKRLFPDQTFIPKGKRVPQDGLVDASLIALNGYWKHYGKKGKGKKNGKLRKR